MGRAAIFLAGALGASACGTGTAEEPNQSNAEGSEVEEDPGMADIYGGPPDMEESEPERDEAIVNPYGAPPEPQPGPGAVPELVPDE